MSEKRLLSSAIDSSLNGVKKCSIEDACALLEIGLKPALALDSKGWSIFLDTFREAGESSRGVKKSRSSLEQPPTLPKEAIQAAAWSATQVNTSNELR